VLSLHSGGTTLEVLDLDAPDAPRDALATEPDVMGGLSPLAATPNGHTLYYSVYNGVTRNDEWDVFSLDLTTPGAAPVLVTDKPGEGRAAQLLPSRTLFLWDDRSALEGSGFFLLDLGTGESKPFRPRPFRPPPPGGDWLSPQALTFSPDGQRIAFAASVIQANPRGILGRPLWIGTPDGENLRPLTPLEVTPVPVVGR